MHMETFQGRGRVARGAGRERLALKERLAASACQLPGLFLGTASIAQHREVFLCGNFRH